ncbi:hypothetical protein DEAC_c19190 [Desulfosporosinus acididurans]|uniref:Uncharacterized protein n=1 Tax=Desulfosporosinus acididurans TaxID=476652 RepID=A0A0J1FSB6_9FIRM|nr:DUF6470 family protein [Desulfosporosinus acididurans]KLU65883.1 hypothetical protein DEAC_c19190 [Desulfosporosinus acididurans]
MIDLQIQQQFGQIGLTITPLQYNLTVNQADLELQQSPAEIFLQQPAATLEIDNTPARESLGYYGMAAEQQIAGQDAKRACEAGISRIVLEGDLFSNLSQKASVAKIVSDAAAPRQKKLQIACTQPIQISVTSQSVECQAQMGGVSVNVTPGTVEGEVQYGSVQAYMEQNPYIHFYTTGSVFDDKM